MADEHNLVATEGKFFKALLAGDITALGALLTDDFMLIDVLSGSEFPRDRLLSAFESNEIHFDLVEGSATRVRFYGSAALVTGQTRMVGVAAGSRFAVRSRYTHVYAELAGEWRLVSAQGTPIVGE
jgi:ketosteroid isomerase-like protein